MDAIMIRLIFWSSILVGVNYVLCNKSFSSSPSRSEENVTVDELNPYSKLLGLEPEFILSKENATGRRKLRDVFQKHDVLLMKLCLVGTYFNQYRKVDLMTKLLEQEFEKKRPNQTKIDQRRKYLKVYNRTMARCQEVFSRDVIPWLLNKTRTPYTRRERPLDAFQKMFYEKFDKL